MERLRLQTILPHPSAVGLHTSLMAQGFLPFSQTPASVTCGRVFSHFIVNMLVQEKHGFPKEHGEIQAMIKGHFGGLLCTSHWVLLFTECPLRGRRTETELACSEPHDLHRSSACCNSASCAELLPGQQHSCWCVSALRLGGVQLGQGGLLPPVQ